MFLEIQIKFLGADYDVILRVQDSIFYVIFRLLRFLENYTSWNLDIYIKRRRIHDLLSVFNR